MASKKRKGVVRVQVTFTEDQWKLVMMFKGVMGSDNAELVRNIVLAWLAEKSVIATTIKENKGDGDEQA